MPLPDPLAGILQDALTRPASLDSGRLDPLVRALRCSRRDPQQCRLALASVAALFYGRPDLIDAELVDALAEIVASNSTTDQLVSPAAKLLEYLASSAFARHVWQRVREMLPDDRLDATIRPRLLAVLREIVEWREDLVGLDAILLLAESPTLRPHLAFLLDHCLERFAYCAPEAFTPERLERVAATFDQTPRYHYFLYALSERRTVPPAAREVIDRELQGRFPFHELATKVLADRPLKIVVTLNAGMGQGDDVVRLVPLLQGLLDANPSLAIDLVTWRTFLYDHPRVTTIPISDQAALEAALLDRPDGVVEFFQPEARDFTFSVAAHEAIERHLAEHMPALLIKGDLGRMCEGREGNRSQFLHQTVELLGKDVATPRGLDRSMLGSIYEPAMRLLAELGLPQRARDERPVASSILTGASSVDAERVWKELIGDESAARPVALFDPFGGTGAIKGFVGQEALLAAELSGVVEEGYVVVILPNGQTWARRSTIDSLLTRVDPAIRAHVRVAPDPAETDDTLRLSLTERPALNYADKVMRLFKYFASYADLIVTVEGWLAHLGYNLGRPFRLFAAAGSFSSDWYPRGRGPMQRRATQLSPLGQAAYSESALLGDNDAPPLAHRPRKELLEIALGGFPGDEGKDGSGPVYRALTSPDPDVRTWATAALGRLNPLESRKRDLLAALDDRWSAVVREAADALIRANVDCSLELGPRYRELLQAEADIARQNWSAVAGVGAAVLPGLFRASRVEIHDVRAGAKALLRQMLSPFVHGLQSPVASPE